MAEQQPPSSPDPSAVPQRLHEVAQLLRTTDHLGPESQQALAELADKLGSAFEESPAPPATTAPVAESIAQVVEALHQGEDSGPLNAARERLREVAAGMEGRAPHVTAFVGQLLATLANLGI